MFYYFIGTHYYFCHSAATQTTTVTAIRAMSSDLNMRMMEKYLRIVLIGCVVFHVFKLKT